LPRHLEEKIKMRIVVKDMGKEARLMLKFFEGDAIMYRVTSKG